MATSEIRVKRLLTGACPELQINIEICKKKFLIVFGYTVDLTNDVLF